MKTVTLRDIADFINGYAFKPSEWNDKGNRIIRIQNLTDRTKPYNLTITNVPEKYWVYKGDILISWSATLDVFEWEHDDVAFLNQHIFKVVLNDSLIIKSFFKYVVKIVIDTMMKFTHGSTMKHIVREDFLNTLIPLPPLVDQKRIAAILDRADALRQKRKEGIKLLDQLRISIFLKFFGDPITNEKSWKIIKLADCCKKITDGTHKTPVYQKDGIVFISAKNIRNGEIDWTDIKYISFTEHHELSKRCNPAQGDILLTKSGSIGMAAVVNVDFEFSLFESLALLKTDTSIIDSCFLREQLNSDKIKELYKATTKGISIKHLHLVDIKELPIILPPISLQHQYSNISEQLNSIKIKMEESLREMDNQFDSLMHRAFKGELLF